MDWDKRAREAAIAWLKCNLKSLALHYEPSPQVENLSNAFAALATEAEEAGQRDCGHDPLNMEGAWREKVREARAAAVAEGLQQAHDLIGALIRQIDYDVSLGAGMAAAQNEIAAALRARGEYGDG